MDSTGRIHEFAGLNPDASTAEQRKHLKQVLAELEGQVGPIIPIRADELPKGARHGHGRSTSMAPGAFGGEGGKEASAGGEEGAAVISQDDRDYPNRLHTDLRTRPLPMSNTGWLRAFACIVAAAPLVWSVSYLLVTAPWSAIATLAGVALGLPLWLAVVHFAVFGREA